MKVVVLCGGYGTRLVRDIISDSSQEYKHLLDVPKALLPVGSSCLLTHWVKIFQNIPEIEHLYIETNDVFYEKFQAWASQWPDFVSVVNDKSSSNASRLGAVASIQYAVDYFELNEDIIVVAGDTLFFDDVDMSAILHHFFILKAKDPSFSLVTVYDCAKDVVSKHGILEVNEEQRVTSFLEKPDPDSTSSRLACPCFYLLSSQAVREIPAFLLSKKDASLSEKDATGNFLNYLHKRLPVYTYKISGRFDVGGLASYLDCLKYFASFP